MDLNSLLLTCFPLEITSMKTSIGELQRNYLFKLVVEDYPAIMNAKFAGSPAVSEVIDLYLTKGVFPNRKTAKIKLPWSGESYYHSGVDESNKEGQLTFRLDEKMKIKDFFEAGKDLTGDLRSHAAVNKPLQTFTFGVYMVNVGKNIVTDYRRLVDVLIYSVDTIELGKDSTDIVTFVSDISWDRQERDDSKRGQSI